MIISCRSQGSNSLRHGSGAVRLLVLRVRIQPGAWMSVSCACCVFSGRCLCDGPITRPEEFYRASFWLWSWRLHMMKSGFTGGCCAMGKTYYYLIIVTPDYSCSEVLMEYIGTFPSFGTAMSYFADIKIFKIHGVNIQWTCSFMDITHKDGQNEKLLVEI